MNYQKTITVSAPEAAFINKALQSKDMMGEDDTIFQTAHFADGMEMDVKLCGAQEATPWTEAVLIKDGNEVCCSEPGEAYEGPWTLECNGNTYTAMVVMEKPENEKEKIKKMAKRTATTTRACRKCGGTEFASGYQVSVECIADGSGKLIRSEEHPTIGACLIEKPCEYGLDSADISDMMRKLGETEVYPVEFFAAEHESSAMGFITAECAEALDYDYQELEKYVAGILDDMEKETEDGLYLFHGFTIMLSR